MITARAAILTFFTILNLFIIPASSHGKCANVFITIKGVIVGPQNDALKIAAQILPDPNSSTQPEFSIKNGHFEGSVLFDTTKSADAKRHECSRVPEKVHVVLLKENNEIDSVWLIVAKDFIKDKTGDYEVRSPVEFHSK
jgi:hypothetical protein